MNDSTINNSKFWLAVKNGAAEAFYRFIDDKGIALTTAGPPLTKQAYARFLAAAKEKKETGNRKNTLEWEPLYSHVSASGDMAYNYGPYKYTGTDAKGNTRVGYGYFITVWKKQPDNSWKFVFDGGNQGPPPGKKE